MLFEKTRRIRHATNPLLATLLLALSTPAPADDGAPDLPWLDNDYYKVGLNVRARLGLADIDGFQWSQAYTLRTRAGLEAKPYYGFSALAELENTWSLADDQYFDGAEPPNGKSIIADPENIELNRAWVQYATQSLFGSEIDAKAKGGRQRIVFDDSRFIGNVGWRQNEQTYDSALGESDFGLVDFTGQYAYLWHIRRIFGNQGPSPASHDYSSSSHLVRAHYTGIEGHTLTAFAYLLDFESDSPGNSSNSYGFRATGLFPLSEDLGLGYSLSYAYQTDAGENPVDYHAHYGWAELNLQAAGLGLLGVTYEHLGSDDGKARFVTPLATAHKFNGFADAFLDNGGPDGLQDLFLTVAPALPWKLKGKIQYHEFWQAHGGRHIGRELDAVVTRPLNAYMLVLMKGAWFDGFSRGPADRWRFTLELDFQY